MAEPYFEYIINKSNGKYCISEQAFHEYKERTGEEVEDIQHDDYRFSVVMIEIIKELKNLANGECAKLEIVRIPEKYAQFFMITEYDGCETIVILYDHCILSHIKELVKNNSLIESKKIIEICNNHMPNKDDISVVYTSE